MHRSSSDFFPAPPSALVLVLAFALVALARSRAWARRVRMEEGRRGIV
jgi:hypothetical protein